MAAGEIKVGQDVCYREPEASATEGKMGTFSFPVSFYQGQESQKTPAGNHRVSLDKTGSPVSLGTNPWQMANYDD